MMDQKIKAEMVSRLHAAADAVLDESTFLDFLQVLATDWETEKKIEEERPLSWHGGGALGWENDTIGAFLEAAASWGKASKSGMQVYEVPSNAWRRAAHILLMGKLYE